LVDDYTQTNAGLPKITWEIIKKAALYPRTQVASHRINHRSSSKEEKKSIAPISNLAKQPIYKNKKGKSDREKHPYQGHARGRTNGYQEASSHAMAAKLTRAGGRGKEKRRKTKRNDGA
jgi:hypothetical protein